jgi:hypothetical protein
VPGKLVSFRFWPKWKFKETTVEPDCFIEFKYINVIIEAKRYDNMGQQYAYQLGKELVAYWTIAPSKEPVMLLAVGGLADDTHQSIAKLRKQVVVYLKTEVSTVPDFAFAAISWARLFGIVKECLTSDHERRLIEDIREAMVLHGIAARPLVWLEDLKRQADRLGLLQQGSAQVFYARVFPKVAK